MKGVTEPKEFGKRPIKFGLAYAGMFRNEGDSLLRYSKVIDLFKRKSGKTAKVAHSRFSLCGLLKVEEGLHFDFHSLLMLLPMAFHLCCSFRPYFPLCFEFPQTLLLFPFFYEPWETAVEVEDPNRDGERGFDYLTSALVSSKAHREGCEIKLKAKGCGLAIGGAHRQLSYFPTLSFTKKCPRMLNVCVYESKVRFKL
ncbi:hypothetical protein Tco_1055721 [Tanacetum coccineum]|uniref:Uncharacterized protein n=1 Tax=Tanacetum coccineum TaxID=301880 RepID=A0ABQ5H1C6_9ASTR